MRFKKTKNNERERRKTTKERSRWYHIKRTYGLTKDQWYQIYNDQGGRCYICQRTEAQIRKGNMKYLTVDHDHITGHIRGLLCGNCNRNILPVFERDYNMARRISLYLTKQHQYGLVPLFHNAGLIESLAA